MRSRKKKASSSVEQWDRLLTVSSSRLQESQMAWTPPSSGPPRQVFVREERARPDDDHLGIAQILASIASDVNHAQQHVIGSSQAQTNGNYDMSRPAEQNGMPFHQGGPHLDHSSVQPAHQHGNLKQERQRRQPVEIATAMGTAVSSLLISKSHVTPQQPLLDGYANLPSPSSQNGYELSPPKPGCGCRAIPVILLQILDRYNTFPWHTSPLLEHLQQFKPYVTGLCPHHLQRYTSISVAFLLEEVARASQTPTHSVAIPYALTPSALTTGVFNNVPSPRSDGLQPRKRQRVDGPSCAASYYDCAVACTPDAHCQRLDDAWQLVHAQQPHHGQGSQSHKDLDNAQTVGKDQGHCLAHAPAHAMTPADYQNSDQGQRLDEARSSGSALAQRLEHIPYVSEQVHSPRHDQFSNDEQGLEYAQRPSNQQGRTDAQVPPAFVQDFTGRHSVDHVQRSSSAQANEAGRSGPTTRSTLPQHLDRTEYPGAHVQPPSHEQGLGQEQKPGFAQSPSARPGSANVQAPLYGQSTDYGRSVGHASDFAPAHDFAQHTGHMHHRVQAFGVDPAQRPEDSRRHGLAQEAPPQQRHLVHAQQHAQAQGQQYSQGPALVQGGDQAQKFEQDQSPAFLQHLAHAQHVEHSQHLASAQGTHFPPNDQAALLNPGFEYPTRLNHGPVPAYGPMLNHVPRLDKEHDNQFRLQVMQELQAKSTLAKGKSHGDVTGRLVLKLLQLCQSPDESEALVLSGHEAAARMEAGPPDCPIFTEGQQLFTWEPDKRPIEQMFRRMENLNRSVSVQVPSRKSHYRSFQKQKLSEVQQRFLESRPDNDDPWNILDLSNPLPPTTMPKFLAGENCQLLLRVRDAVLGGSSGERTVAAKEKWNEWLNVMDWVLLSEGGHNTAPHTDSHGLSTWITVQEGLFGFGWLSKPTKEEREAWITNPQEFTDGRWRFTVLTPGKTVFFPSGTIHFVFRLRYGQTLALGGHVLQWNGIERWINVVREQMGNPQITNEDVEWSAPKYVHVIADLVKNRVSNGRVDEVGGQELVDRFFKHVEAFDRERKEAKPAASPPPKKRRKR